MQPQVVAVIGAGGMGAAIARQQGPGRRLVLADIDREVLEPLAMSLDHDGYDVRTEVVDVGSRDSVTALADALAEAGELRALVHTAGLSPLQASTEAILRVDLLGVALVLEVLAERIGDGGAAVVIASMAGQLIGPLPAAHEKALLTTPADDLLSLPFLQPDQVSDPGHAYAIAKRASVLRVQAASVPWGKRGARINSISPGVIATSMGREELAGESGGMMRSLVDASATGRVGTSADIAHAAAFLLDASTSFVTGTDLLVDGGVTAAVRAGQAG